MSDIYTIRELIDLWPTRATLADDMALVAPFARVTAERVNKWPSANAIPSRFHQIIIDAGALRGFEITADVLVRLHAAKPVSKDKRGAAA